MLSLLNRDGDAWVLFQVLWFPKVLADWSKIILCSSFLLWLYLVLWILRWSFLFSSSRYPCSSWCLLYIWHFMLLIRINSQPICRMIQIHRRLCLQALLWCWLTIDWPNRSILQQRWMALLSIHSSLRWISRLDIWQKAVMIMWYVLMAGHHHLLLDEVGVEIRLINQVVLVVVVLLLLAQFYLILTLRWLDIMLVRVRRLDGVFILVFAWGSCVFQILLATPGGIWHIRKLAVSICSVVASAITNIELLILMFHSSLHQMLIIHCFLAPIR